MYAKYIVVDPQGDVNDLNRNTQLNARNPRTCQPRAVVSVFVWGNSWRLDKQKENSRYITNLEVFCYQWRLHRMMFVFNFYAQVRIFMTMFM